MARLLGPRRARQRHRPGPGRCRPRGAPARLPLLRRPLPWTRVAGDGPGCWFAICTCGTPAAHHPLRPDDEPADPIAAAFGPARAPDRPPWIRVFQLTSGHPWWLPWRHLPDGCPACRQQVTFAVWTRLPGGRTAYSALCLACGQATSEYLWPRDGRMREAAATGSDWSPPCVAVARLRRAVFSPQLRVPD